MKRMAAIAGLLLAGCTDEGNARRALEQQGYSDIRLTGYEVLACSKDDAFHTGFAATSIAGRRVHGVVCSSWGKGTTVRTF